MEIGGNRFFEGPEEVTLPQVKERFTSSIRTLFQLLLLFPVLILFKFENDNGLHKILMLSAAGFAVNELLPLRYRPPFFLLLGIASVFLVTDWLNATIIIGCGLFFIGLSHLPLKPAIKYVLIIGIGIVLALVHVRIIYVPFIHRAIPFIASIFMFRWMLYLHELRYGTRKILFWHRFSYFFMLPNISFPLFPIVDFKEYTRCYYNTQLAEIHRNAIKKIFRGTVHLLLYRAIYFYLIPAPAEVDGLATLLQYLIFGYLLILRLSGLFHLSLGLCGLFGYNLSDIFNNYLLADSFSDLWRRINIYWREFVVKIFYQPIFFKLKRSMPILALPLTILIVFCFNYLLHNYQWFWLRGSLTVKANDIIFWMIFGVTVTLNSLYQVRKHARGANNDLQQWSVRRSFFRMARIAGMLLFMSSLWALWCGSSVGEWIYIYGQASGTSAVGWMQFIFGLIAFVGLAVLVDFALQNDSIKKSAGFLTNPSPKVIIVYSVVLLFISIPSFQDSLPEGSRAFLSRIAQDKLNVPDKLSMERGYYQKILSEDGRIAREIWQSNAGGKKEWTETNKATRQTNDLLMTELLPGTRVEFKGAHISTNRWGMRDKDYKLQKEKGVYRFAMLGGSYEMGSGIEDRLNFESLLEDSLNDGNLPGQKKIEILNFAVGGYHIFQNLEVFEKKALAFKPDVLLIFAHSDEYMRASRKLAELIIKGTDLKYRFIKDAVECAGISNGMCSLEIEKRIKPFMPGIFYAAYAHMAAICSKNSIKPVWVFLPAIDDPVQADEFAKSLGYAQNAGFVIITLTDIYKNCNLDSIRLSNWDNHPNKQGHRLIAGKLYKQIIDKRKELNF